MKKYLKALLVVAVFVVLLAFAACAQDDAGVVADPVTPPAGQDAAQDAAQDPVVVDGVGPDGFRFAETVHITSVIWDRGHERMPDMTDNGWTDWIREQMLEIHNIHVDFVEVPRWDQGPFTTTLIGAGAAPDLTFHFGGRAMTNTFAEMGALLDLMPLLERYRQYLPNMYDWFGDLMYYDYNPLTGQMFAIPSRRTEIMRQHTFIREDWLNTLGIAPPTTFQEFENALIAFRDNAELLLGDDAHMMIPFALGDDVGWGIGTIVESLMPDQITERELFIRGFCARRIEHPSTREAVRIANRWFHEGLVFQEFAYGEAGTILGDYIRLGVVGAQIANWDMPFRGGGDQQIVTMREHRGPDANFIPILPFPNDAGRVVMYAFNPADRRIVLPHTNQNQLATLLYIDFMARQSTRDFLAFGIEGEHHVVEPNGAIRILPSEDWPDNMVFAAVNNFDINFVANGFDLGDDYLTVATLALAYPGIEAEAVMEARSTAIAAARVPRSVTVRPIAAEEGMTTPLSEFRDTVFHNAVMAAPEDFDAVWDSFIGQYFAMGAQAIIDERDAAWVEAFGDVPNMPGDRGW